MLPLESLDGSSLHHPLLHAAEKRIRRFRVQLHQSVVIRSRINTGAGLELRQRLAFFLRDAQTYACRAIFLEHVIDTIKQSSQSDSLHSRHMYCVFVITQGFALLRQK